MIIPTCWKRYSKRLNGKRHWRISRHCKHESGLNIQSNQINTIVKVEERSISDEISSEVGAGFMKDVPSIQNTPLHKDDDIGYDEQNHKQKIDK